MPLHKSFVEHNPEVVAEAYNEMQEQRDELLKRIKFFWHASNDFLDAIEEDPDDVIKDALDTND